MDEIRYKNLYDSLISQIDYCNFLESYGESKVTFENTNFDLLQTIYGAFALTHVIEDYFIEQNNTVKCTLMPEALKQVVSCIAIDNGNGYTVGDLMYHDEYTVLQKLRNKLAHGDFIIRNGEIVFEENKVEGRVKVEHFLQFITTLETEVRPYQLNAPYVKVFNKCIVDETKIMTITNEKDMDFICDYLYRIECVDTPIFPNIRDANYIRNRSMFYDSLKKKIASSPLNKLKQYMKKVEPILTQYGIDMKYSIQNIKELEYYKNIKEKYMDMNEVYQNLSIVEQLNRINNLSYILGNGQYQKLDMIKGLELNRYLLQELKKHPNYSLKEIVKQKDDISTIFMYHVDSAILSSYLVGFNSIYEYGLEKGLTQKGNYNIVSIFEGKALDFSQLEIEKLDDPNMLIEHTFEKYLTDASEYEEEQMKKIDSLIQKSQHKLAQYKNYCKKIELDKIEKFEKEIEEREQLKRKLQIKIEVLKQFTSVFDLEKYTRNINIITHIRNAIAHGNVFVDSYATSIPNTDIIFRDFLNDTIVYEKKIKVKDFVSLFYNINIQNIYRFITENIEDKNLIEEHYYEKVISRNLLRENVDIRYLQKSTLTYRK